jgi:hypothetical protein
MSCITFESQAKLDSDLYLSSVGPDDASSTRNLDFYRNAIPSEPDGALIDTMHDEWRDDFAKLEAHHSYIQWLLPTRDRTSSNGKAQPLQRHEARAIDADPVLRARALRSLEMMLRFWGFDIVDRAGGVIVRCSEWESRFANLCCHPHNNLRITRALKFAGEIDALRPLQAPLAAALCDAIVDEQLLAPSAEALVLYWVPCVRDGAARAALGARAAMLLAPPDAPLVSRIETTVARVRRMRASAAAAGSAWDVAAMENVCAFAHLYCRRAGERALPATAAAALADELFATDASRPPLAAHCVCCLDLGTWRRFVCSATAPKLYKQELGRLPAFATSVRADLSNYDPEKWPTFLRRYADFVAGVEHYKQLPAADAAAAAAGPRLADDPAACASALAELVGAPLRTARWYLERALAAGALSLDELVTLYFDQGAAPPPPEWS